jgi:hypothetical protein
VVNLVLKSQLIQKFAYGKDGGKVCNMG